MDLGQLPFLGSPSWTRPVLLALWPSGSPPAFPGPKRTAAGQWHRLLPSCLSLSVTRNQNLFPTEACIECDGYAPVHMCALPSQFFPLNV